MSKWTGKSKDVPENGRIKGVKDSLVMMVDQLWILAVDEGGCHHRGTYLGLVTLDDPARHMILGLTRTQTRSYLATRPVSLYTKEPRIETIRTS